MPRSCAAGDNCGPAERRLPVTQAGQLSSHGPSAPALAACHIASGSSRQHTNESTTHLSTHLVVGAGSLADEGGDAAGVQARLRASAAHAIQVDRLGAGANGGLADLGQGNNLA